MDPAAASTAQTRYIQTGLNMVTVLNLTRYMFPPDFDIDRGCLCFDYIIVGAGAAGCVLANRLTECPDVKVLLIEAGDDTPFEGLYPGLAVYLQKSKSDWNYTSVDDGYTQQCKKGKVLEMARGKVLGGSSVLNYMAYTRGNPHDYNIWARAANDDSWQWQDIQKYFIKSEKLNDSAILNSPYGAYHGTDGYLGVSTFHYDITNKYFNALKEMGNPIVLDTNSINYIGYADLQLTILNGIRQGTSNTFLTPIKDRSNLYVMKNALVSKIIFDESLNAVGVEVLKNNKKYKIRARKEVIISAGAINTPQLLMLSGIGPADHLKKFGIQVLVNSTQVGKNLQDHIPILIVHRTKKSHVVPKARDPKELFPYIVGYVALNKSQEYADYQAVCVAFEDIDVQSMLQFCSAVYLFNDEICNALYEGSIGYELFFTVISLLNPKSRGEILLQSSNPLVYPLLYTNFYSNNDDLEQHVDCVLDFMEIVNTDIFKSMNSSLVDPSPAMCRGLDKMSREYIKCYVRCLMASQYHYVGTAAMGTVVDNRLRVYGVKNLRVVDASIMPHISSANTYAPTLMLAEKGADMIKEDGSLICNSVKGNGF